MYLASDDGQHKHLCAYGFFLTKVPMLNVYMFYII